MATQRFAKYVSIMVVMEVASKMHKIRPTKTIRVKQKSCLKNEKMEKSSWSTNMG